MHSGSLFADLDVARTVILLYRALAICIAAVPTPLAAYNKAKQYYVRYMVIILTACIRTDSPSLKYPFQTIA